MPSVMLHTRENCPLTLSFNVLWDCPAVGVGSWCFHMTLLYEMQVGYSVMLKSQYVNKKCVQNHEGVTFFQIISIVLLNLHESDSLSP